MRKKTYFCTYERACKETNLCLVAALGVFADAPALVAPHPRFWCGERSDVPRVCAAPVPRPPIAVLGRPAPMCALPDSHADIRRHGCRSDAFSPAEAACRLRQVQPGHVPQELPLRAASRTSYCLMGTCQTG